MRDLISRSELIKELNKYCGNQRYLVSENIREIINNQPNAYSVDKVVEELEKLADESYKAYCIAFNSDDREEYDAYTNAIEIAQAGCVSDDCCEWQPHRNNYVTSCEEDFVPMMRGYKYCPYCGKKIKVVE